MDDRKLADLSERIRRANEEQPGGPAPPAPLITFEQLYADNKESDEAAMARRAAERKARWQQQQQGVKQAPAGNRTVASASPLRAAPPSAAGNPFASPGPETTGASTALNSCPLPVTVESLQRPGARERSSTGALASSTAVLQAPDSLATAHGASVHDAELPAALRQDLQAVVAAPAAAATRSDEAVPVRNRRAVPAGPLRKPDTAEPGLARLMRRPTSASS
ncbi:hypothetical protein HYH03_015088 [Edaphochlamys debaryana]|uniref:Uncharacterized protein n=1 Tax=Edaphochlamys debaryana TaxID=47281 RepID=A0A836BSX6_9CHLO|nr:hypothetical protein HYH03_015088 [Edaphochlamys debaryana]|eukprot:KAG2486264.1 hypothetical protein HYH03_015088 [Edaphochlamys debaryana]